MNATPLSSKFLIHLIVCIIINSIIVNCAVTATEPTPNPTSYWTVHKGHQCKGINGFESDLLRDWNGTAAECKEKCINLGVDCVGFVRINVGADEHAGNCYFRSTKLSDISESTNDDRDCFVRNAFYTLSPTQAPTEPTTNPTFDPTTNPTTSPSDAPSATPTNAPSNSPTRYPIQYVDFESEISAFFLITQWTYAQISDVNGDLENSFSTISDTVHQGFDADSNLEYRDIVLNISMVNGQAFDNLINGSDFETGKVLMQSIYDGMELQYLIQCRNSVDCAYILADDAPDTFNRSAFEKFVDEKLNECFAPGNGKDSDLVFVVENITWSADIEFTSNAEAEENGGNSTGKTTMIILGVLIACTFICGVSVGIIIHHRKVSAAKNVARNMNAVLDEPEMQLREGALSVSNASTEAPRARSIVRGRFSEISMPRIPTLFDNDKEGMQLTGSIDNQRIEVLKSDNMRDMCMDQEMPAGGGDVGHLDSESKIMIEMSNESIIKDESPLSD